MPAGSELLVAGEDVAGIGLPAQGQDRRVLQQQQLVADRCRRPVRPRAASGARGPRRRRSGRASERAAAAVRRTVPGGRIRPGIDQGRLHPRTIAGAPSSPVRWPEGTGPSVTHRPYAGGRPPRYRTEALKQPATKVRHPMKPVRIRPRSSIADAELARSAVVDLPTAPTIGRLPTRAHGPRGDRLAARRPPARARARDRPDPRPGGRSPALTVQAREGARSRA